MTRPPVREEEEGRPLERDLFELVGVPDPPAGFAETVVASAAPSQARPRRSWVVGGGVVVAGALAVASVVLLRSSGAVEDAVVSAADRTTWSIGSRAVAVGEPGAALSWRAPRDGAASVVQTDGDVFYRVNDGHHGFRVQTPAGTVSVTGTCFRVEVERMPNAFLDRKLWASAAVGAAVAAGVVVTVYEGRVDVANAHGNVELAAGQRGTATDVRAPLRVPAAADDRSNAAAAVDPDGRSLDDKADLPPEARQREIEALRARLRALETKTGTKREGEFGAAIDFVNPSKEELGWRAKKCRLEWDSPGLDDDRPIDDRRAERIGLVAGERDVYAEVRKEFVRKSMADLRRVYVEVSGNSQAAEALSGSALYSEIVARSPEGEAQEVFKRLSAEKAGLMPASASPNASPLERMMRLFVGLGDGFEAALGAQLGPARARELRVKQGGWGSKTGAGHGCPDR